MEKAIEIKRRAQRCILNGDLDGALSEYEKLVASGDSDPYHSVLLADLLFKKGDPSGATRRYLEAVNGYEAVGLYRNAIAVCKKMSRLSLAPIPVLHSLAKLHALDGLATESSLYYMQHADLVARDGDTTTAVTSLRQAFQVCPDNVQALERLADLYERTGARTEAGRVLLEAAGRYERLGQLVDARRCEGRAHEFDPTATGPPGPRPTPDVVARTAATSQPLAVFPAPEPSDRLAADDSPPSDRAHPIPAGSNDAGVPAPVASPGEVPPLEIQRFTDSFSTPSQPGLAATVTEAPGALAEAEESVDGDASLPEVSTLLHEARALFDRGERDAASNTLVRAAQTYDRLGRLDNAATIYRSLSQVTQAPLQVMMLWLKNCQRRGDRHEAARVACDLGDRSLADGDSAGAREWFERGRAFDPTNDLAQRRLRHLDGQTGESDAMVAERTAPATEPGQGGTVAASAPRSTPTVSERGHLEVTVTGQESMIVDLGLLISELQTNLETLLASDPQSHYDLGMSYREMGLLQEAITCFRAASQESTFVVRCTEMIQRCRLEQGDFEGAAEELRSALQSPDLVPESSIVLGFQLALALEAGGRLEEALTELERVRDRAPDYPDVAGKIESLRATLGKE